MPEGRGEASETVESASPILIFTFHLWETDDAPCVLETISHENPKIRLTFLIDTGASTNIISYAALSDNQRDRILPASAIIKGVTEKPICVAGYIVIEVKLGPHILKIGAYVINDPSLNLKTHGVLSRNFLRANGMALCDLNSKINFRGEDYPLITLKQGKEHNPIKARLHLQEIIPPMTMVYLTAKLPKKVTGQFWLKPKNPDIRFGRLGMATALFDLKESNEIQICVINMSPLEKTIKKKTVIGTLLPIDEQSVDLITEHQGDEKEIYDILSFAQEDAELVNVEGDEPIVTAAESPLNYDEIVNNTCLDQEQKEKFKKLLSTYDGIFYRENQPLSTTPMIKARIETTELQAIKKKQYPIPYHLRPKLREEIKKLLDTGVIKKCNPSNFNSPCLIVSRKVGDEIKYRMVIDFRLLNKFVKNSNYEFPDLHDLISQVGGSDWLSSLDLCRAYNQIPLHEDDQHKTNFSIFGQSYCYTRLPFGLSTAPKIFQSLVNRLFLNTMEDTVSCYLDDVLIHSSGSFEIHLKQIEKAFEILKQSNLKLNFNKCKFFQKEIEYLGFRINRDTIVPLDHKMEIIQKWPTPKSAKQVQRFIGLISFFRRFVPSLAEIIYPLTSLLGKKKKKFIWTETCEEAFQLAKEKFAQRLRLVFPDCSPDAPPFKLFCDASHFAIGHVLAQEKYNEELGRSVLEPIAFGSRSLNSTEQNYEVYRKELVAIVYGCKSLEKFLLGKKFEMNTDHKPLLYLFEGNNLRGVFIRYLAFLSNFHFEIKYVKGLNNNAADALSRINFCNGKIEYVPEVTDQKQETYSEFIERWERRIKKENVPDEDKETESVANDHIALMEIDQPEVEKSVSEKLEKLGNLASEAGKLSGALNELRPDGLKEREEKLMSILEQLDAVDHQDDDTVKGQRKQVINFVIGLLQDIDQAKMQEENKQASESASEIEEIENYDESESDEDSSTTTSGEYYLEEPEAEGDEEEEMISKEDSSEIEKPGKMEEEIQHQAEDSGINSNDSDTSDSPLDSEDEWLQSPVHRIKQIRLRKRRQARKKKRSWKTKLFSHKRKKKKSHVNAESNDPGLVNALGLDQVTENENDESNDSTDVLNRERVLQAQLQDRVLAEVRTDLLNKSANGRFIADEDGLIYKVDKKGRPKVYIPKALEKEIIKQYHESIFTGHPGIKKLTSLMKDTIYLPNLDKKVKEILATCQVCAKTKPNLKPFKAPLKLFPVTTTPFDVIHLDFAGGFDTPNDNLRYLLVITDRMSHWVELYALENQLASTVERVFLEEYVPMYGLPQKIVTDGGPQFSGERFKKMCEKLNIQHEITTPHRPMANGQAEKAVKLAKNIIRSLIAVHPGQPWHRFVPYAKIALRSQVNEATKMTPYKIVFTKDIRLPVDAQLKFQVNPDATDEDMDQRRAQAEEIREIAAKNQEQYQQLYKKRYDKKAKPHNLKPGQLVYVKNLSPKPHLAKIYQDRNLGPYEITKINETTAHIKDKKGKIIKIHVDRLKPTKISTNIKSGEKVSETRENENMETETPSQISDIDPEPCLQERTEEDKVNDTERKEELEKENKIQISKGRLAGNNLVEKVHHPGFDILPDHDEKEAKKKDIQITPQPNYDQPCSSGIQEKLTVADKESNKKQETQKKKKVTVLKRKKKEKENKLIEPQKPEKLNAKNKKVRFQISEHQSNVDKSPQEKTKESDRRKLVQKPEKKLKEVRREVAPYFTRSKAKELLGSQPKENGKILEVQDTPKVSGTSEALGTAPKETEKASEVKAVRGRGRPPKRKLDKQEIGVLKKPKND